MTEPKFTGFSDSDLEIYREMHKGHAQECPALRLLARLEAAERIAKTIAYFQHGWADTSYGPRIAAELNAWLRSKSKGESGR